MWALVHRLVRFCRHNASKSLFLQNLAFISKATQSGPNSLTTVSGTTLNFQKSENLVTKNPKIEQQAKSIKCFYFMVKYTSAR